MNADHLWTGCASERSGGGQRGNQRSAYPTTGNVGFLYPRTRGCAQALGVIVDAAELTSEPEVFVCIGNRSKNGRLCEAARADG